MNPQRVNASEPATQGSNCVTSAATITCVSASTASRPAHQFYWFLRPVSGGDFLRVAAERIQVGHLPDRRLSAITSPLGACILAHGEPAGLVLPVIHSALVPNAKVVMTNDGTGVAESLTTDQAGLCIFNALKPASYTGKVSADGFKTSVREHIVLRVGQQLDLPFSLEIGSASQTLVVEGEAPLINTVSGALGTEVTNRYIIDMPLLDRSLATLSYLAPGVTEVTGSSINNLGGTNFVSNGQRYATAEFRLRFLEGG